MREEGERERQREREGEGDMGGRERGVSEKERGAVDIDKWVSEK